MLGSFVTVLQIHATQSTATVGQFLKCLMVQSGQEFTKQNQHTLAVKWNNMFRISSSLCMLFLTANQLGHCKVPFTVMVVLAVLAVMATCRL